MKTLDDRLPLPHFDKEIAARILPEILREEITKTGLKKAVLGVSGGIDSALSLALAVRALGKENVFALMMPYKLSAESSLAHAELLAKELGVDYAVEELTDMADPYFERHSDISRLRKGNVLARYRMVLLYDYSAKLGALVVGTSNKTEILLGYSTLWGDMASAVNPIGDLYKTQVWALSRHLGVPDVIIQKAPSADLWEGQTDEDELQISYELADRILYQWVDLMWSQGRIREILEESGEEPSKADLVFRKTQSSQYKRLMPVIAKISERTVGREFRYPRDWGL